MSKSRVPGRRSGTTGRVMVSDDDTTACWCRLSTPTHGLARRHSRDGCRVVPSDDRYRRCQLRVDERGEVSPANCPSSTADHRKVETAASFTPPRSPDLLIVIRK